MALAGITVAIAAEHHLPPVGVAAGNPLPAALRAIDSTIVAGSGMQPVEGADVCHAVGALTIRSIAAVSTCTACVATSCSVAKQSIVGTEQAISGVTKQSMSPALAAVADMATPNSGGTVAAAFTVVTAFAAVAAFTGPIAITGTSGFCCTVTIGGTALQREVAGSLNCGIQRTGTGSSVRNSRNTVFSEGDT